jgi:hypothetical protein
MKPGINLRGDLAKLSDQELADRLKACWEAHEATGVRPPRWYSINIPLHYSFRAPIRHPRVYRLLALHDGGQGWAWMWRLFVAVLTGASGSKIFRGDSVDDAHLSLCEIRDIMDEIERRVKQRQQ